MKKTGLYAITAAAVLAAAGAAPFSSQAAQNPYLAAPGRVTAVFSVPAPAAGTLPGLSGLIRFPICTEKPSMPQRPEFPQGPCGPEVPQSPELPEIPQSPQQPEIPQAPGLPDVPQIPEQPETPQSPELPDAPENNDPPGTDGGVQEPGAETPAAQVLALVNAQRARAGLGSLSLDPEASKAAGVRAREIQISFSHTRPDGRDFSTALSEAGASFRASGENIAYGQRSAEQVMDVWMNSAGHRANILNPGYSRIGIGHVKDSRGVDHWVQLFLN